MHGIFRAIIFNSERAARGSSNPLAGEVVLIDGRKTNREDNNEPPTSVAAEGR